MYIDARAAIRGDNIKAAEKLRGTELYSLALPWYVANIVLFVILRGAQNKAMTIVDESTHPPCCTTEGVSFRPSTGTRLSTGT